MKDYSKEYRKLVKENDNFNIDTAKSELDRLFNDVISYRTCKHYKDLMKFCSKFKYLAPFNAMMIQIQRPGSRYVLTASQWEKKWNRRVKPNARPVVILSYQPVSYLFELSDTESIDGNHSDNERLLEEINKQYDTKQKVDEQCLKILIDNLPTLGIAYTDGLRAGVDFAAQIELLDRPQNITIPLNKTETIEYKARYLISVNETLSVSARYASILHELGHFFCHHIEPFFGGSLFDYRNLSNADKEFEAESVAWLTCERLNIVNPSERYIAGYASEMIPANVSIDQIFKAHNEIWKLLFEQQYAKNSFLYKNDKYFNDIVNLKSDKKRIR